MTDSGILPVLVTCLLITAPAPAKELRQGGLDLHDRDFADPCADTDAFCSKITDSDCCSTVVKENCPKTCNSCGSGISCALPKNSQPCHELKDRVECLSSTDSRRITIPGIGNLYGSDCVWCPQGSCTKNNANRCEPKIWLKTIDGANFEECTKQGISCALPKNSQPCHELKDRVECLSSTDSRRITIPSIGNLYGSDCVWCPQGPCTENNANRCEPKIWLKTIDGANFEECTKQDTATSSTTTIPTTITGTTTTTTTKEKLWAEEKEDKYCKNREIFRDISTQSDCQTLCTEGKYECVGISYSQKPGQDFCYLCKDDTLSTARNSYGFYRRPVSILKPDHECKSADEKFGEGFSLHDCENSCRNQEGCKFFIFGKGGKEGRCYWEKTSSSDCPEGWEDDQYDFYGITVSCRDAADGVTNPETLNFNKCSWADAFWCKYEWFSTVCRESCGTCN